MKAALLVIALVAGSVHAAESAVADAQLAQMEALRAEVAAQIQFQAYDLLDELVFSWIQEPIFTVETPVVLAHVSVPVGFGSGLQALIENHVSALVVKNPRTRVLLAHCPSCTALWVHSGSKGTVVSRGVDEPSALVSAGALSGSRHALFLDFEAEGESLVLRARITSLEPALPIVYARTLSTSTSAAALLRSGERLKTAAEARREYVDALEGRGVFLVPMRMGIRTYAPGNEPVVAPPFAWLQAGLEVSFSQARAWTGAFSFGATWTPQSHWGWLAQGRLARLLTGTAVSLTRPDLYAFFGGSVISIYGPGAAIFQNRRMPTLENLLAAQQGQELHSLFAAFQIGLEMRVKNRIGVSVFLESAPALNDVPSIGRYLDLGIISFHSFGAEVSFCF